MSARRPRRRQNAPVIHLRPIELASYIKAKPLIIHAAAASQIEFPANPRAGETALELGIAAHVLREELLARGVASAVTGRRLARGGHHL